MARTIFAVLRDLEAGLAELREALAPLAALAGTQEPAAGRRPRVARAAKVVRAPRRSSRSVAEAPAPVKKASTNAKRPSSPAVRAQRAAQGKYMGILRGLSKQQQAEVKKARAADGIEAAIKLAASFGK